MGFVVKDWSITTFNDCNSGDIVELGQTELYLKGAGPIVALGSTEIEVYR